MVRAIIADWGVNKAEMRQVLGVQGSLTLSLLADKLGCHPMLICVSMFSAMCMLATAHVTTITQLLAIRCMTGLGLGAIMPNVMAMAGEFSPNSLFIIF